MDHRDIHRARQGDLYLRETRELMREFGRRVWREWIQSHTDRRGWFYLRHNKCDSVAAEVAMHEDREQARFVEWDWDYVLVDHKGWRVEGDVRQAVQRRVAELFWEAN